MFCPQIPWAKDDTDRAVCIDRRCFHRDRCVMLRFGDNGLQLGENRLRHINQLFDIYSLIMRPLLGINKVPAMQLFSTPSFKTRFVKDEPIGHSQRAHLSRTQVAPEGHSFERWQEWNSKKADDRWKRSPKSLWTNKKTGTCYYDVCLK